MDQLFEQIAQLPLLAQMAVYAGIGWGIAYFARKQAGKEPQTPKTEMVMSGISSITDMKPIRELVDAVKELVEAETRTAEALRDLASAQRLSLDQEHMAKSIALGIREELLRRDR